MSGFDANNNAVPVAPTDTERMKPGFERSIMYQRTGFTNARVREACMVEAQGSFLCRRTEVSNVFLYRGDDWEQDVR